MNWFIVAIASYFILAAVNLVDKRLLVSLIPSPRIYAFYVGILGALVAILIPFVNFRLPDFEGTLLALTAGAIFVLALLCLYWALRLFEASRVVPTIGGLTPIFAVFLIYLLSGGQELLPFSKWPAFVLLLWGTVLINRSYKKSITYESFMISAFSAFLFALYFVLSGFVYLAEPFWNGLIVIKLGGLLPAAALFLFSKEVRSELFQRQITFQKKTMGIFVANQVAGAGANLLQNWAIALAPLVFIPVINALQGTQYVFLLILTVLFSFKFPHLLKEEVSAKVLGQKIIAVLLIAAGTFLFFVR